MTEQVKLTAGFGEDLRLAEYKSVREEWIASRDAQQHTLQWTFAASAVLFAAIVSSDAKTEEPFLFVVLTAAVAALATFSQAVWFGEVVRMERAALFLRGLETVYRELPKAGPAPPPLTWETWRGNETRVADSPWIQPASSSIVGSFGLFFLLTIAAIAVLLTAALDGQMPCGDRVTAAVFASFAIILYALVSYDLCSKALYIYRHRGDAPDLAAIFAEASSSSDPPSTV
jgi:hypothetical protein